MDRFWRNCFAVIALLACASGCDGNCPPGTTLFKGRDNKVGRYVQVCARNGSIGRHGEYKEFYDNAGKHLARKGNFKEDVAWGLFVNYDAKGKVDAVECFGADDKRAWRDAKANDEAAGGKPCP